MSARDHDPTRRPRRARRRPPTLRRTGMLVFGAFLAVILGLGATAVGVVTYQRNLFDTTTSELEGHISSVVDLENALRDVDEPASGILYFFGGQEAVPTHQRTYAAVRGDVEQSLRNLAVEIGHHDGEDDAVARANAAWDAFDDFVQSAPGLVATGQIDIGLGLGQDPFAEAWVHLKGVHEALTDLRVEMVHELRDHMVEAHRVQDVILQAAAAVFLVALGISVLAARTLQRRVLRPIQALQEATRAMSNATAPPRQVVTDGSVAELAELASALESTALSLRASHQQLHDQAHTDGLTGLANRQAFVATLDHLLEQGGAQSIGALFIDLDDFKVVNDTMGHAAGDELLRVVARRLQSATRGSALTARLGGDEFAIVIEDVDEQEAVVVANRLLESLDAPVVLFGKSVNVGCSIGVAIQQADLVAGGEELIHNADQAMYTAKKHGKHRVEVFSAGLYAELQSRTELRHDLAGAVERNELLLHYQPVLDLQSGTVLGLEALVRWEHPQRGLLGPGEFIPLAEETGDILALGDWVIDEACRQMHEWHQDGTYGPQVWISVNVSASQLEQSDLVQRVAAALARHDIEPRGLVFEITEAVAVTNTARAVSVLESLRRLGVTVALDDFGKGFSSLGYLADLPVDVLKIDRSFITSRDDKGRAALNAIVMLGHRLGLQLIAEGVETADDLDGLRSLGNLAGQGFLFARPMPAWDTSRAPQLPRGQFMAALPGPGQ